MSESRPKSKAEIEALVTRIDDQIKNNKLEPSAYRILSEMIINNELVEAMVESNSQELQKKISDTYTEMLRNIIINLSNIMHDPTFQSACINRLKEISRDTFAIHLMDSDSTLKEEFDAANTNLYINIVKNTAKSVNAKKSAITYDDYIKLVNLKKDKQNEVLEKKNLKDVRKDLNKAIKKAKKFLHTNLIAKVNELKTKLDSGAFSIKDISLLQQMMTDKVSRDIIFDKKYKPLQKDFNDVYSKSIEIMAKSLTAHTAKLYSKMNLHEPNDKNITKEFYRITKEGDNLKMTIENSMLEENDLTLRTLKLDYWIRVAGACLHGTPPDLNTAAVIFSAIEAGYVISKFKETKSDLSEEAIKILGEITPLLTGASYPKHREFLNMKENADALPYAGAVSNDFVKLGEKLSMQMPGVESNNYSDIYETTMAFNARISNAQKTIEDNQTALIKIESLFADQDTIVTDIKERIEAARNINKEDEANIKDKKVKKTTLLIDDNVSQIYGLKPVTPETPSQKSKLETTDKKDKSSPEDFLNFQSTMNAIINPNPERPYVFHEKSLLNYADWIYTNKITDAHDPIKENPLMKMMAATALMLSLRKPEFFSHSFDKNNITKSDLKAINQAINNIELTKIFLKNLNADQLTAFTKFLNSKYKDNQIILDNIIANKVIPSELKVALLEKVAPNHVQLATLKTIKALENMKNEVTQYLAGAPTPTTASSSASTTATTPSPPPFTTASPISSTHTTATNTSSSDTTTSTAAPAAKTSVPSSATQAAVTSPLSSAEPARAQSTKSATPPSQARPLPTPPQPIQPNVTQPSVHTTTRDLVEMFNKKAIIQFKAPSTTSTPGAVNKQQSTPPSPLFTPTTESKRKSSGSSASTSSTASTTSRTSIETASETQQPPEPEKTTGKRGP